MALPLVMPANNPETAEELAIEFPGRIGTLLAPGAKQIPESVPFVLDNGRFAARKGGKWDSRKFRSLLDLAADSGRSPEWIVVPDVVGKGADTVKDWHLWVGRLERYGWPLALAVQPGISVGMVKELDRQPDIIFVGGGGKGSDWKWLHLRDWCNHFPRVHVGRVGTVAGLWRVQKAGVESSDSNVWRPVGRHLIDLRKYLKESNEGSSKGKEKKGFGLL